MNKKELKIKLIQVLTDLMLSDNDILRRNAISIYKEIQRGGEI